MNKKDGEDLFSKLLAEASRLPPGRTYHVNVRHDDWCDILAKRGPCNCNPEVQTPVSHDDWKRRN